MRVVLSGLSQGRASLLCSALDGVAPGRFGFDVCERPPSQILYDDVAGGRVLLFAARGRESDALAAIRRLRGEEFYWGALHLCADGAFEASHLSPSWGVRTHTPPPDVRTLSAALLAAGDLDRRRRAEIVRNALTLLAEDSYVLLRSLDRGRRVSEKRVEESFRSALLELRSRPAAEEYGELKTAVERVSAPATFTPQELDAVAPLVMGAEARARELDDDSLVSALHSLNNVLRLATYQVGEPTRLAGRVLECLRRLRERGLSELPPHEQEEVGELLAGIESSATRVTGGDEAEPTRESLAEGVKRLNAWSDFTSGNSAATPRAQVRRILVIEDDDDWRREICSVLGTMSGLEDVEVRAAGSLGEAEGLLKDATPALALVDLGLPSAPGSALIPDAGLGLIKTFTSSDRQGRRYGHRFIVLTAAEGYAAAVRSAISYGVSPSCYLQKGSATWESDLRAQVRLQLTAVSQAPRIQVFRRTGRVARIEGLEIKLDYPQWCVLAVLAEARKGVWCEARKISSLLYWNYSLNPEARNRETEALEPEQRILLQLPHYTSELRKRLNEAYTAATHRPPADELLSYDEETGYRLNAAARVLDRVEEHFHIGRSPSVLVVEDSPEWGEAIVSELGARGFRPRPARWIEEALDLIGESVPDLVSLDMELPLTREDWEQGRAGAGNTVEFLNKLRALCGDVPVAVLTAIPWRDNLMLEVLRRGVRVDDYLSKQGAQPIRGLASSLHRLWQEALTESRILDWDAAAHVHPVRVDPEQGVLTEIAGHPVKFSGLAREILRVLSRTPNTFVSRSELLEVLYGDGAASGEGPDDPDGALNSHLRRIRAALTAATGGEVPGDEVICGDRGVYWLRGLVQ